MTNVVRFLAGAEIFSPSPPRPDRPGGSPNLLSGGGGSFPGGRATGA